MLLNFALKKLTITIFKKRVFQCSQGLIQMIRGSM